MKNLFRFLILGAAAMAMSAGGISANEAEPPRDDVIIANVMRLEKTKVGEYSYTDGEGNTGTLTLYDDGTCSVSVPSLGIEGECSYSLEGDICTLTGDGKSVSVKLNSDGTFEPVGFEETKPCHVSMSRFDHGEIEVDALEGDVGDIVTIDAKSDLLYKVDFVAVNGTNLVEDERTRGRYSFALVAGENVITASFVVDEELCGELTDIVAKIGDGDVDWVEDIFNLRNLIDFISWIFGGGILFAIARYFIKDKKLEKTIEDKVVEVMTNLVPGITKTEITNQMKGIIEPMFGKVTENSSIMMTAMGILMKGLVLMQQGTPEAKIALLDEFDKMKTLVDPQLVEGIKKYIEDALAQREKNYGETMANLDEITERHKEEITPEPAEEPSDDGTQI